MIQQDINNFAASLGSVVDFHKALSKAPLEAWKGFRNVNVQLSTNNTTTATTKADSEKGKTHTHTHRHTHNMHHYRDESRENLEATMHMLFKIIAAHLKVVVQFGAHAQ